MTFHYDAPGLLQQEQQQQHKKRAVGASPTANSDEAREAERLASARKLAQQIRDLGCRCGVALSPETPAAGTFPLIAEGAVDLVSLNS